MGQRFPSPKPSDLPPKNAFGNEQQAAEATFGSLLQPRDQFFGGAQPQPRPEQEQPQFLEEPPVEEEQFREPAGEEAPEEIDLFGGLFEEEEEFLATPEDQEAEGAGLLERITGKIGENAKEQAGILRENYGYEAKVRKVDGKEIVAFRRPGEKSFKRFDPEEMGSAFEAIADLADFVPDIAELLIDAGVIIGGTAAVVGSGGTAGPAVATGLAAAGGAVGGIARREAVEALSGQEETFGERAFQVGIRGAGGAAGKLVVEPIVKGIFNQAGRLVPGFLKSTDQPEKALFKETEKAMVETVEGLVDRGVMKSPMVLDEAGKNIVEVPFLTASQILDQSKRLQAVHNQLASDPLYDKFLDQQNLIIGETIKNISLKMKGRNLIGIPKHKVGSGIQKVIKEAKNIQTAGLKATKNKMRALGKGKFYPVDETERAMREMFQTQGFDVSPTGRIFLAPKNISALPRGVSPIRPGLKRKTPATVEDIAQKFGFNSKQSARTLMTDYARVSRSFNNKGGMEVSDILGFADKYRGSFDLGEKNEVKAILKNLRTAVVKDRDIAAKEILGDAGAEQFNIANKKFASTIDDFESLSQIAEGKPAQYIDGILKAGKDDPEFLKQASDLIPKPLWDEARGVWLDEKLLGLTKGLRGEASAAQAKKELLALGDDVLKTLYPGRAKQDMFDVLDIAAQIQKTKPGSEAETKGVAEMMERLAVKLTSPFRNIKLTGAWQIFSMFSKRKNVLEFLSKKGLKYNTSGKADPDISSFFGDLDILIEKGSTAAIRTRGAMLGIRQRAGQAVVEEGIEQVEERFLPEEEPVPNLFEGI